MAVAGSDCVRMCSIQPPCGVVVLFSGLEGGKSGGGGGAEDGFREGYTP